MKRATVQDLGSIGELVAAAATVMTLFYLAIQIRSNTIAARSAAAQSVHEAYAAWYRMLAADETLAVLVTEGLRDYASLSEAERARFVATFMAFLSCCQDAYIKWCEGSLNDELWMGWELVMMNFGAHPAWESILAGARLFIRCTVSQAC